MDKVHSDKDDQATTFASLTTRRNLLGGAAMLVLVGCGGEGAPAPVAVAPPAPTPVPTVVAPPPPPLPTPAPAPVVTPAPAPVASTRTTRLKAALATGRARPDVTGNSATVTIGTTPTITGEIVANDDPRIRLLGATWRPEMGYPGSLFRYPLSTTYNAAPRQVAGNTGIIEFGLLGTMFELFVIGSGTRENFAIEVDGVPTNADGYDTGPNSDGAFYYIRVVLTASDSARRIRLVMPIKPLGSIAVPGRAVSGFVVPNSLVAVAVATPSSAVFIGDSITEGSNATRRFRAWPIEASYRLGLDNPIVSGVGGSGYVAALGRTPGSSPRIAGFPDNNFRRRIDDVLRAVDGGPPDMVVIAGGINDRGVPPAELRAEALAYFRALRAGAPDMAIVVLGPFVGYSGYDELAFAGRDAIFAAAGEVARVATVDTSRWVTTGNRDQVFDGNANGPHPLDAGHKLYGQLAAEAIAPIIRAL